jgi:hypothetical protein
VTGQKKGSEVVEEPDDVGEVDPAVHGVIERGDRFRAGYPGHPVGAGHDIRDVIPVPSTTSGHPSSLLLRE